MRIFFSSSASFAWLFERLRSKSMTCTRLFNSNFCMFCFTFCISSFSGWVLRCRCWVNEIPADCINMLRNVRQPFNIFIVGKIRENARNSIEMKCHYEQMVIAASYSLRRRIARRCKPVSDAINGFWAAFWGSRVTLWIFCRTKCRLN